MLKVCGAILSCWIKDSFSPSYNIMIFLPPKKLKKSNVFPLPLRGTHAPSPTPSAYKMLPPKTFLSIFPELFLSSSLLYCYEETQQPRQL